VISDLKKQIDFVEVARAGGVEFDRSGMGLCPFHDEQSPSFKIYEKNGVQRGHCFGCNFDQDVIGFVQKIKGCSFQDALRRLGVEQKEITPEVRQDINRHKYHNELIKEFRAWENSYLDHISKLYRQTRRLMLNIAPEDLNWYAPLLHMLPVWEYHRTILISGDDQEKFELFKEAQKNDIQFSQQT